MLADHFQTLSHYNAWANRRLYDACAALDPDEYLKPRQAFFGSIHGTLNHILLTDRNWFGRLAGRDPGLRPLDRILCETFADLRQARDRQDREIIRIVAEVSDADLAASLTYSNTRGETFTTPVSVVLGNIFNHQTHHRGQVHDMLSQTPVDPPPLDLLRYSRASGP